MNEKNLENIEKSFEEACETMRKQEELNNREPIKLTQIDNLNNSYVASFRDENKNEYVLLEGTTEDKVELCRFHIEPEYSIKVPVEIKGTVINPKFSFWLDSCIYNKGEFMKVLEKERLEDIEKEP